MVAGRLDDLGNVGDAAAAGGYGNGLAGLDGLAEIQGGELSRDFVRDAGHSSRVEGLPNPNHLRELHGGIFHVGAVLTLLV